MHLSRTLMISLVAAILLCSCSNDNEKESKPGKIDTMTKEIGQEAVQMIKTPLDKAQAVADQEEKRVREMEERGDQ